MVNGGKQGPRGAYGGAECEEGSTGINGGYQGQMGLGLSGIWWGWMELGGLTMSEDGDVLQWLVMLGLVSRCYDK